MGQYFRLLFALSVLFAWQVGLFISLPQSNYGNCDFEQHHRSHLSAATTGYLRAVKSGYSERDGNDPRRIFVRALAYFSTAARQTQDRASTFRVSGLVLKTTPALWLVYGSIRR